MAFNGMSLDGGEGEWERRRRQPRLVEVRLKCILILEVDLHNCSWLYCLFPCQDPTAFRVARGFSLRDIGFCSVMRGKRKSARRTEDRRCRDRKTIPSIRSWSHTHAESMLVQARMMTTMSRLLLRMVCRQRSSFHLFRRVAIRDRYIQRPEVAQVARIETPGGTRGRAVCFGRRELIHPDWLSKLILSARAEKLLRNYRSGEI